MKFIVEIPDDGVSCKDVKECFLSESHLIKSEDVKVTELPPTPEVKKIATGILMSPAEICKCDKATSVSFAHDNYCHTLYNANNQISMRLKISDMVYPREFYRDIRTEWDFDSIPVGSLVEVVENKNKKVGWLKDNEDDYLRLLYSEKDSFTVEKEWVKTIRIIELPKEEEI